MFIILFGNKTLSLFLFTASISITQNPEHSLFLFGADSSKYPLILDRVLNLAMVGKDKYRQKEE